MKRLFQTIVLTPSLLFAILMLGACSAETDSVATETSSNDALPETEDTMATPPTGDVIARVGDQEITFSEISVMLNSAAVVGLSIPALGTPERDTVRITLLDKFIDANLIYLDALRKGVDKEPQYQRDLGRLTRGMLAERYLLKLLGDVSVSDAEIDVMVEQQLGQQLEMYIAQNLIVRDGDKIRSNASFNGGQLLVNGQALPLFGQ